MKNIKNYMIITLIVLALPVSMIGCGGSGSGSDGNNNMTVADLAGTWEINSLASGTDAPWWERGTLTVNSDGTSTGSMTESDASTSTPSGTLSISNDGIITLQGSATLQGSMDSGKTVMVWTDTWGSGTTEIKVITKK